MACRMKDLSFPKILLAMRTIMASFMSIGLRQKHVFQRRNAETDPKQRGKEEKQSYRAKVSIMKDTN